MFKMTFVLVGKIIIVETVIDYLQIRLRVRVTIPVQHFIFIRTE